MHEQELEKIIEALRDMESRFEQPTTAAAPHLSSTDRAAFKRLILEAKGILGAELGVSDFGLPLLQMTNLPGFGAFNPPMLEQLHEAIGLVEGGLNQLRRKSSQLRKVPNAIGKPTYVDPGRILQLRSVKSQHWDLKRLVRLLEELNVASLSGILCAGHSMTKRSMYANQQEDDEGGDGRSGGNAVDPQGTH